jgi:nucleotide-binding universal stress UspA family protein
VCVPAAVDQAAVTELKPYRSVLIPTDLSALSNRAIAAGYALLSAGGEAHLLHVLTGDAPAPQPPDLKERLQALIPANASALGLRTRVHIVDDDDAWSGISHVAERLAVDAVCMSTHGRGLALQFMLGSQTQEVLRRVRVPVLLVKGEHA